MGAWRAIFVTHFDPSSIESRFRQLLAAGLCGRSVRVLVVLSLMLGLTLSGCVTELLTSEEETTRNVACAVIAPQLGRDVLFALHREGGVQRVPLESMWLLAQAFGDAGFGTDRFQVSEAELLPDNDAWTLARMQTWAESVTVLEDERVTIRILWVEAFADEGPTTLVVSPGIVAVSEAAVVAGAARLEQSEDYLARVLLLHVVGHALGTVNQGIPLNGTDVSAQEGPAGHEPALDSVMHAGWDRVATMPRTNAPYDGYSELVLDDWRAASRGVCA